MQVELTDFKESYMVDGAMILFKDEPDIHTIEKVEQLLKEIATNKIRQRFEMDL